MACRLGACRADSYRVTIADRTGPDILELDFESLTWERLLDGISTATVQIPADCCGKLKDVRSWRHELHIARDGDTVWQGPISIVANCRTGISIEARDVLWWLTRRVIHNIHCWTASCGGNPIGSVPAAVDLIRDGFTPDDPNVLTWLTQFGTGVVGGRIYEANSQYVIEALDDLAKGSIDYTTVGRRIIVMPQGYELGRSSLLTCEHFAGDVCVTEDGYAAATRAVVTGDEDLGIFGTAGGTDDYFGLIEVLVEDTNIKENSTAAGQALGLVNGSNPPPLLVQPPQGSYLAPSAPVCLSDLVPGVTVPVSLDCTCRTASQNMRLMKLAVTVDESGERIAPLLTPIGFLGAP